MKKLILCTALIAISLQAKLYAQNDYQANYVKQMKKSKAEQTFNADERFINIRDFVVLQEGRMTLELSDVHDYESFRNLDSILRNFRRDIAFYKDSLDANPTGHMRIDYALNPEYSFKKIRIKKYEADGNFFMNRDGEVSKLKYDQDTIRIIMQKSKPGLGRGKIAPCMIPYSVQVTFVLGNYYDIDKVLADNILKKVVDTLEKASLTKKAIKNIYGNPFSIIYNPYYNGKGALNKFNWLINDENDIFTIPRKNKFLTVTPNIGIGEIRNTITPMAEIGLQYNKYTNWNRDNIDFFKVSIAPYFFFDKDAQGNYITNDNWFINADIGSRYEGNGNRWLGNTTSFGVGYLVAQKGDYFKNTTFKIFTDLQIIKRFTISPEFIFTNNCKQIFPGFTVKVF